MEAAGDDGFRTETGDMSDNTNPLPQDDPGDLEAAVIDVLRSCYDPEIPVNIYDLGLIYEVRVDAGDQAYIRMTLTSPMCPVAESLPVEIETKIRDIAGISDVTVEVVWDPPWTPEMMSEDARLELNMF